MKDKLVSDLRLKCECGKVELFARDVSPRMGNRLVCYCQSCQQFPIKLGKPAVLDEFGGTEIYQLPASHLEITAGREHIKCMKHSEEGLPRFYAGCCDTPIANAPGLSMPFIGLLWCTDTEPEKRDERLGPIRAHGNTEDAIKPLPPERKVGLARLIIRFLGQMLFWRIQGKGRPHPFFGDDGQPIVEPEVRPGA